MIWRSLRRGRQREVTFTKQQQVTGLSIWTAWCFCWGSRSCGLSVLVGGGGILLVFSDFFQRIFTLFPRHDSLAPLCESRNSLIIYLIFGKFILAPLLCIWYSNCCSKGLVIQDMTSRDRDKKDSTRVFSVIRSMWYSSTRENNKRNSLIKSKIFKDIIILISLVQIHNTQCIIGIKWRREKIWVCTKAFSLFFFCFTCYHNTRIHSLIYR